MSDAFAEMLQRPAIQHFVGLAHKRSVPPKQTLMHAGDSPQSLYLILEGSVSILLEDDEGREIVLAYLNPGEFFGEMCLFPQQPVRSAIVRTRTPTLLAEMGLQGFRSFAHEQPEIMFDIAGQLAARLRDTSRRVGDLTFLDVAGRLARVLLDLASSPDARPHPRGVVVKISRQELARIVGCSREMVGRVLKSLEAQGLVYVKGKTMVVFGTR